MSLTGNMDPNSAGYAQFESAHAALARFIEEAAKLLAASRVTTESARQEALAYCLSRGTELCNAIYFASRSELIHSTAVLARALYETLLWAAWVQMSEANAERFGAFAHQELLRQARKNLESGLAVIRDKRTEQDLTSEFLAKTRPAKPLRLPRFDRIAEEAGLAKLHTAFYGLQSLEAHGSAFGLRMDSAATNRAEALFTHVAFSNAMIKSITKIARNWFEHEEVTPSKVILDLLMHG